MVSNAFDKSIDTAPVYPLLGNVKLISCLVYMEKNSMHDALKSFYFCLKKLMCEN